MVASIRRTPRSVSQHTGRTCLHSVNAMYNCAHHALVVSTRCPPYLGISTSQCEDKHLDHELCGTLSRSRFFVSSSVSSSQSSHMCCDGRRMRLQELAPVCEQAPEFGVPGVGDTLLAPSVSFGSERSRGRRGLIY